MDENMLRMQQEAAERVRRMQERARRFVDDDPHAVPGEAPRRRPEPPPGPPGPQPEQDHGERGHSHKEPLSRRDEACGPPEAKGADKGPLSFLSGFGKDSEQLLLLMLAVLLVRNEGPIELVLALLYLAM